MAFTSRKILLRADCDSRAPKALAPEGRGKERLKELGCMQANTKASSAQAAFFFELFNCVFISRQILDYSSLSFLLRFYERVTEEKG